MEQEEIVNHEIGHGIIAYIFNGDYYKFEGIKLNPEEKFYAKDLAYTISKPIEDIQTKVEANSHHASAVDGLFLLGGIAGLTVFKNGIKPIESTFENYRKIFDCRGSEGDFQRIFSGRRPYGVYMGYDSEICEERIAERHSRLLNLLGDLFARKEILSSVELLKQKLMNSNELTLEDFNQSFDADYIRQIKVELSEFILGGLGKPILLIENKTK